MSLKSDRPRLRPVLEPREDLPPLHQCSSLDYVAFRSRIVAYVARGASPRMVADRLGERMDQFTQIQTSEIADLIEMGDTWCPPDRRDLWPHFRSLPKSHGNVLEPAQ
jgi:hypothetical protein